MLQQEAKGRDRSFTLFGENKIGILLESDYFWRSVVEPRNGVAKMADRDTAVGWALVPAKQAKAGVGGQDFVSMSGGGVRVINPNTRYPRQAWEFMQFLNSAEAVKESLAGAAQLTQRQDVNDEVLKGDPMLTFISEKVLPITRYRPGLADYPKVSAALQQVPSVPDALALTPVPEPEPSAASEAPRKVPAAPTNAAWSKLLDDQGTAGGW